MDYNTVLRSLRYALKINDEQMAEIFSLDGLKVDSSRVEGMLKKEEQEGFIAVDEAVLKHFLDGLILQKRGPRKPGSKALPEQSLNNNMILKKIRIALELREEDMLRIIQADGFTLNKAELSALFRKRGHKHYRECGDQLLRNFLKGLSQRD